MLNTLVLVSVLLAAPPAAAPPNVVLIVVDDLGWRDLSCQGGGVETPHIDRLAAEGMRFTDAYAACAVCSPTRAAVLTGRSPARLGLTNWIRARFQRGDVGTPAAPPTEWVGGPGRRLLCPPNPYWMERGEQTIAERLRPAGYVSAHIGKWHLGDDAWYPTRQGFDENHGGCDYGQPPSYFDPYVNRRLPDGIPTMAPRTEGEYLTDREADEAASFIARHADRPFFLHLAHYAVHTPIQGKPEKVARFREAGLSPVRAKYAAMLESLDEAVGRVTASLEDAGVADRTLVILTSDNGGLVGPTDNAPLRAGKGTPYEGGLRVPLLVRWPGVVPAGSVSAAPVTSVDLLPTILAATGVEADDDRPLDGVSLLGHLRSGGTAPLERGALYWHFPHYRRPVTPYAAVRSGPWKLIRWFEGPRVELFHLGDDLGERDDRAGAEPERAAALERRLMTHLESVGARTPRPNPAYRPRVLLLGDSISMGYTDAVRERLADGADVFRAVNPEGKPENCAGTTKGVAEIDRWLADQGGRWDVIHFNFGLHDLKRVRPDSGKNSNDPSHPRQAEPELYERQLREVVAKLEATGAALVFATTTPIPPGGVRPHRGVGDPALYNGIARAIMDERGIAVNDLYGFVEPRRAELLPRVDVHFTEEGSRELAAQVVAAIRMARERRAR